MHIHTANTTMLCTTMKNAESMLLIDLQATMACIGDSAADSAGAVSLTSGSGGIGGELTVAAGVGGGDVSLEGGDVTIDAGNSKQLGGSAQLHAEYSCVMTSLACSGFSMTSFQLKIVVVSAG